MFAHFTGNKPDFIGAPYEFWVGSNVGIGTSVGQIRINEVMNKHDVSYDLLHGYEEGGIIHIILLFIFVILGAT